jgi:hypothetical protein
MSEKEFKEIRFETIAMFFVSLFPLILLDDESEFFKNETLIAMLVNFLSFTIIYLFLKSLKLSIFLTQIMTVLFAIWLCLLPILFYKIYLHDTSSFSYNREYLPSLQRINKNDFNQNEKTILKNTFIIQKELKTSIFKKQLPTKSDTLILTNNYIILSPHNNSRETNSSIKFYDKNSGKFLFLFEKKSTLLESYNYFNKNLKFKFNKIKTPEVGISYFDFWCSSIISFKDNLIIPLRNWIIALNFIYILIIIIPILNYIKEIFLKLINKNKKM